jgi:hypothetical protein
VAGCDSHIPMRNGLPRQLTEVCGWDEPPRYLIRDRDGAYGAAFIRRIRATGIRDRPVSARSPWQNGYAQRLIGSIRRESLDDVIVVGGAIFATFSDRAKQATTRSERTYAAEGRVGSA